jgi:ABC-2 type transport system ATP-binding protein
VDESAPASAVVKPDVEVEGATSDPGSGDPTLTEHHPSSAAGTDPSLVPAIRTRGLVKQFGAECAVDHLDLEVLPGQFFGFLGPNGAGKSTTMRILCGLLRPTRGTAEVVGMDVVTDSVGVKARIGVLPEEPILYERLTGREMLWYAGRLYGVDGPTIEARSRDLFTLMALSTRDVDKAVVDYSMGMRKKLGLACALLHRPRVLFLDEPFNGIDAVTSRAIYGVLQGAVSAGMTVFFTSHVLEVAEALCTSVGIIDRGRLLAVGSLDEVRTQLGASPDTPLGELFVDLVDPATRTRGAELLNWLT